MRLFLISAVIIAATIACVNAGGRFKKRGPTQPTKAPAVSKQQLERLQGYNQSFGHIYVSPNSSIFYWLFYTIANVSDYKMRPLVLWLQNDPYLIPETNNGIFELIGPLDLDLNVRNHTWIKHVNVLFVDSSVSSGFSYFNGKTELNVSDETISNNLVNFMKGFYEKYPEFRKVSLHIFGEGYNGKIAPNFAYKMFTDEENFQIESVTIGNGWIAPVETISKWGQVLHVLGYIDLDGFNQIQENVNLISDYYEKEEYHNASLQMITTLFVLETETKGLGIENFFRPIYKDKPFSKTVNEEEKQKANRIGQLEKLMSGPVRTFLNLSSEIKWKTPNSLVSCFGFLKPGVQFVEKLLNESEIKVNVYSGQENAFISSIATEIWVDGMNWINKSIYKRKKRTFVENNNSFDGFKKQYGNFAMYWIFGAGNAVAQDNPHAAEYILKDVTQYHVDNDF